MSAPEQQDRFQVESVPDPAWPKRTLHFVRDTQTGMANGAQWRVRRLAQADADRRNAKHRSFNAQEGRTR